MIKRLKLKRLCKLIVLMVFLFSIFQIGNSFAATETFSLKNVEIVDKSGTAEIDSVANEGNIISNNIIFYKLGDFITYKITLKNNESQKYILNSIRDDNTNEYISYEYDNYQGTTFNANEEKSFNIKVTYSKELTDISEREQLFSVKFTFNLEDENGNNINEEITVDPTNNSDIKESSEAVSTNPKTGDNIGIYVILAIISFTMLIILSRKNFENMNKKETKIIGIFILVALLLPTIVKASTMSTLEISIQNLFKLYDKLIISTEINGEIVYETVNYGDTLTEPEEPSKPGYKFKGWYLDDGTEYDFNTPITGDISLNPEFEIITYNITYNLNDGEASNPLTYTVEDDEITLNEPTKEGYTFIGWSGTDLTGNENKTVTIPKSSTSNRTYTANFVANTYTIIFDRNSGLGTMPNQVMTYDENENLTTNAYTKTGYTFIGWNTNADGTGTSYDDEQNVKNLSTGENVILYAQWKINVYFLDFHSNGASGTQMERQRIVYGEETTITPNQYTNSNLLFAGWNTKADETGTYYTEEQVVKNLTTTNEQIIDLYATWKEFKVGDYVDYDSGSGNGAGLIYKSSNAPQGTNISATFKSNDITKWRIFSISDGEVTLVAEKPTVQTVELSGAYGYINGDKILNDIGNIYGHGIGAKGGRSIKLEDIEPNLKYDKSTFNSGTLYGQTRTYTSGKFIVDDNIVTASASSPQILTQTVHWYNINDYAYSIAENETKNKIYNMLCVDIPITNRNGTNPMYSPYWLASKTQYLYSLSGASYGLHYIGDMHSTGTAEMGNRALFSSAETVYTVECSVLPIVELKQSIKYTYNKNTESWNINYVN